MYTPNIIVIPKADKDKSKSSRAAQNSLLDKILVFIKEVQDQGDRSV